MSKYSKISWCPSRTSEMCSLCINVSVLAIWVHFNRQLTDTTHAGLGPSFQHKLAGLLWVCLIAWLTAEPSVQRQTGCGAISKDIPQKVTNHQLGLGLVWWVPLGLNMPQSNITTVEFCNDTELSTMSLLTSSPAPEFDVAKVTGL